MLVTEIIESVKVFLKKLHINPKHEWLKDCVEYLNERDYDLNKISVITKEQWLLNDLRQVSVGCLPPNIKEQTKFVLDGNFVLQINSKIDIGMPAYQQYNKLKNINNENIEATFKTEDKIQSHRMLKFNLTDGVQDVIAIEYKCINKIKGDLTPGYKILVKGPLTCRNGVILLTNDSIELMSGEVKELQNTNSKMAILLAKLGLSDAQQSVNSRNNAAQHQNHAAQSENITALNENNIALNQNNQAQNQNNLAQNQNTIIQNQNNMAQNQNNIAQNQNTIIQNQNNMAQNQNNIAQNQNTIIQNQNNMAQNQNTIIQNQNNMAQNQNNIAQNQNITDDEIMGFDEQVFDRQLYEAQEMGCNTHNIVKVSASPFVYIKQISDVNEYDRNGKVFKVKAQILHLLKRPAFSKDKWMVECKITDGTGCLNVKVSSDLFSTLISHTPQQMVQLGLERQSSPASKERIDKEFIKYLSEAKRKLESLYCIMELKMSATPVVTQFIPFREQHVMLLQKRLQGL